MGWTWEYVERHMDLHRHAAMQRAWRRSPPVNKLVQGLLGVEPQEPDSSEWLPDGGAPMTEEEENQAIAEFCSLFSAAGGAIN